MHWTPIRNAAKFSFANSISSFCKMVTVATEIHSKGLHLHIHLSLWQVVYSSFFFI